MVRIFVDGCIGTRDEDDTLSRLEHEVVVGRSLIECMERPFIEEKPSELLRDVDALVDSTAEPTRSSRYGPLRTTTPRCLIAEAPA